MCKISLFPVAVFSVSGRQKIHKKFGVVSHGLIYWYSKFYVNVESPIILRKYLKPADIVNSIKNLQSQKSVKAICTSLRGYVRIELEK